MPRPDEPRPLGPRQGANDDAEASHAPSKTQRKREMHALQGLGEALVALDPKRFDQLAAEAGLPERLIDAIREARAIVAHGARKRQLQYVGRLMREQDPAPVRQRLDLWARGHASTAAHDHAIERWRERLLAEPGALDALAAAYPKVDRTRVRALVARAREERSRGAPPRAFREIFRELRALDSAADPSSRPTPAAAPPDSRD